MHPAIFPFPVTTCCFLYQEFELPVAVLRMLWPTECTRSGTWDFGCLQRTGKLNFFLLATLAVGHHPSNLIKSFKIPTTMLGGAESTHSSHMRTSRATINSPRYDSTHFKYQLTAMGVVIFNVLFNLRANVIIAPGNSKRTGHWYQATYRIVRNNKMAHF